MGSEIELEKLRVCVSKSVLSSKETLFVRSHSLEEDLTFSGPYEIVVLKTSFPSVSNIF